MTTVQLSSTFNTVHKNTSHINEQSVYTQGRPRTCDHMERFHGKLPHGASISLSLSLSLSLFLSLSFSLSLSNTDFMYKKDFQLESQVGPKKEGTCHEKVRSFTRSRNCSRRCCSEMTLSKFSLELLPRTEQCYIDMEVAERIHQKWSKVLS